MQALGLRALIERTLMLRRTIALSVSAVVAGGVLMVVPSAAGPVAPASTPSTLTDPTAISQLAEQAYIWSLAPEFVYRFMMFNSYMTGPVNALAGATEPAAWNNSATNAPDASVLYLNSMINLSGQPDQGGTKELVLTVPPSASQYYVVDFLDGYINTVASVGTRTTPSNSAQTYLIAGPTSKYQHVKQAKIKGVTYRVIPTDTNVNWMLIRVLADSLAPVDASDSAANVYQNTIRKFALNPLADYQRNGNKPIYPATLSYPPTTQDKQDAQAWASQPTDAVSYFAQAGTALQVSPLPVDTTGLGGLPIADLPPWLTPQAGATDTYQNPAYGQASTLASFAPLGLSAAGFAVPSNWGSAQLNALQAGLAAGQELVIASEAGSPDASTNFWTYINDGIGTYPNTPAGYLVRAEVVLGGGSANMPQDAIYAQSNALGSDLSVPLDGNRTYALTFLPASAPGAPLPAVGTLPPLVNGKNGLPKGFWSLHVYQPDNSQSAAPFLSQAAVLNTAYSKANLKVLGIDPKANTLTVQNTSWATMKPSSAVMFGKSAAKYGLTPRKAYYIATAPKAGKSGSMSTLTFSVSSVWQQQLSASAVPIQNTGAPGPITDVTKPKGAVDLTWGPIQSVVQLGSDQLKSNSLVKNADGSITIWVGPTLPAHAAMTNWIPTPSAGYFSGIYPGVAVNTNIRLMMRMYYPAPGYPGPSILPYANPSTGQTLPTSYVFPLLQQVN